MGKKRQQSGQKSMSRLTKVMRVFTVVVVLLTFIVLGSGYFVIRAARGLQANSAADLKNENIFVTVFS